ncbi:T6SS immunity protein Tli4 family protein [Iodobacter sp.]|uniref:T6SS immunity protein Tli4 family protein n=1 Tax=Iodobacter sp. TaxID=1915058 RepID=UPI0025E3B9A9|nr:T6SS immunity protein Tli4 family protein [Iodobacter sp.]
MKMIKFPLFVAILGFNTNTYAVEPTMFENTKTYCFGRYLVDVPVAAELKNYGNSYIATKIDILKANSVKFEEMAAEAESKLKGKTQKEDAKLVEVKYPNSKENRIIVSVLTAFGSDIYGIDTFKYAGNGYVFKTSGETFSSKLIEKTKIKYDTYLNKVRYRNEKEIPSEPGFCFENGFVANDGKTSQAEEANLYLVLKNNPYVKIRISSDVYFKQHKPLLERTDETGIRIKFASKIKTFKRGNREVNTLKGEEILDRFPSDDEAGVAHSFVWETLGEVGNPLKASIHLEVNTGEGGGGQLFPSTLTDQEVMALYETIVKSIRIRPTQ